MNAIFQGGPFDGQELAIFGGEPEYLLLVPGDRIGWTAPIVVGAGFDDHWPGQVRYEKTGIGLAAGPDDAFHLAATIYSYVP